MQGMLNQMFGTSDGMQILVMILTRIIIVLTILPVHEYAHARMAKRLGDDTAERMGRLTLNPLRHLDVMGAVLLVFFGFGFAKPVPVNPGRFTNQEKRRGGMALTALAGPLSNLIMAFGGVIIFCIINAITGSMIYANLEGEYFFYFIEKNLWYYICSFLMQFSVINISLAVFNLLPIPPLDGSRIFGLLFPEKWMMAIERYGFAFIIAIFFLFNRVAGVGNALGALTQKVFELMFRGVAAVFGLFGAQMVF